MHVPSTFYEIKSVTISQVSFTDERCCLFSDRQQVVHDEQEDGVAQDEGHLEGGAVHSLGRQQEAEEVHCDEEAAGDQQVHHIEHWPTSQNDLGKRRRYSGRPQHFSQTYTQGIYLNLFLNSDAK